MTSQGRPTLTEVRAALEWAHLVTTRTMGPARVISGCIATILRSPQHEWRDWNLNELLSHYPISTATKLLGAYYYTCHGTEVLKEYEPVGLENREKAIKSKKSLNTLILGINTPQRSG